MIKDSLVINQRHKRFVKTVCETQVAYALSNEEGYATCSSIHFEDEEGEPIPMICFWSETALAKSCIKDGWSNYELGELPLSEFLENWCIGMYNDGLLIGTSFDSQMFGYEAEPLELLQEILSELLNTNQELELNKYDNIQAFLDEVEEVLSEED